MNIKFKRIISFIVISICLIFLIACGKKQKSVDVPEDVPSIWLASVMAKSGDSEVKIPINISNNPGVLGITLKLEYDESSLELLDVIHGEALQELTFTPPGIMNSGCQMLWDGEYVNPEEVTNGEIAILCFSVRDNTPKGDYEISVRNIGDIIDNDLSPVEFAIIPGCITIK